MICQQCQTNIDDDLIFCTNCGQRLFQPQSETETIVQARNTVSEAPSKSRPTGLIALGFVGFLIVAAAIGTAAYLYVTSQRAPAANAAKTPAAKTPAKKPTATNKPSANSNTASQSPTPESESEPETVMDERIEIAAGEHYARPFEVSDETAKILGRIRVLEGGEIKGFVFSQKAYDEHFPDETYKEFSFEGKLSAEIDQTMVRGKYVLVLINDTEDGIAVEGKVTVGK